MKGSRAARCSGEPPNIGVLSRSPQLSVPKLAVVVR